MKIKISKSQWEQMGKRSGWMNKKADIGGDFQNINAIVRKLKMLLPDYGFGDNPSHYEDDEVMKEEIMKAEHFLIALTRVISDLPSEIEQAKLSIGDLKNVYKL